MAKELLRGVVSFHHQVAGKSEESEIDNELFHELLCVQTVPRRQRDETTRFIWFRSCELSLERFHRSVGCQSTSMPVE